MPQSLRPCKECGTTITLRIARDLERKFFCSRACAARFHGRSREMRSIWTKANTPEANAKKGRPGELNGRWLPIGTKRQSHIGGYVEVKLSDGWEYEHRVVADAPPGLSVHHRDGNPKNNDPANLELMTRSDHSRWHGRSRIDFGQRWSIQHECCLECSTVDRKHEGHGYCTACYQRRKKHGSPILGGTAQGDASRRCR